MPLSQRGQLRSECFVRRIDVTGESGVSVSDADVEIEQRMHAVTVLLSQLKRNYHSTQELLTACDLPETSEDGEAEAECSLGSSTGTKTDKREGKNKGTKRPKKEGKHKGKKAKKE